MQDTFLDQGFARRRIYDEQVAARAACLPSIATPNRNAFAIGRDVQRAQPHVEFDGVEDWREVSLCIPRIEIAVASSGDEILPIGGVGQTQHRRHFAFWLRHFFPTLGTPYLDTAITSCGGDLRTVWREYGVDHPAGMGWNLQCLCAAVDVPYAQTAIGSGGQQP